uniref:Acid phosphatase n=1 Tax=Acrobeloides nanus TaxID=290746 RepID=A0A914CYL6_9BILA
MSNLIGFYYNYNQGTNGTNYPSIAQWPQGYVPIAIHSFDYDNDHIGNPDATCKRQDDIWKLAQQTPEYQNFVNNATFKASLAQVQNLTGWTDLNFENMWYIDDTLYIEHFVYNLPKVDTNLLKLFDFINLTTDISYDWTNGWELTPYKGINFTEELRKVRGGTLLWSIIDLMNNKIYCRTNPTDTSGLCNWMNKLKYYAYSAHDTTLAALFATFGFKRPNYNEDGYPHYSSCVTVELWLDNNTKPYVKVLYWPLNQDIEYVTQYITGCDENCSLDKFINRSLPYKPGNDGNIVEWCNVPLFGEESTTPKSKAGMSIRILNLIYNLILIMCLISALLI